jgi:RHS repeat-associated protein
LEYFPYGETWVHELTSGGQSTPYKFTSKELDPETNLYYFGARYYDARLSRWVSADRVLDAYLDGKLGGGGVYRALNLDLYHYAGNNPLTFIDPDGNVSIDGNTDNGKADNMRTDSTPNAANRVIPAPGQNKKQATITVTSVIEKNEQKDGYVGVSGYNEITYMDEKGTIEHEAKVFWGGKVSANDVEHPTKPSAFLGWDGITGEFHYERFPVTDAWLYSPGSKYRPYVNSPYEQSVQIHLGERSEGCPLLGPDVVVINPIGVKINDKMLSRLNNKQKLYMIHHVKDNRSSAEKKKRPLPY